MSVRFTSLFKSAARRPLTTTLPCRRDGHVIAERLDVAQDVRREEDGAPLVALLEDQIAHLFSTDGIEAAHGLIEDQELGIGDQRRGQPGALQHALRQATHRTIGRVPDAHLLEHGAGAGADLLAR